MFRIESKRKFETRWTKKVNEANKQAYKTKKGKRLFDRIEKITKLMHSNRVKFDKIRTKATKESDKLYQRLCKAQMAYTPIFNKYYKEDNYCVECGIVIRIGETICGICQQGRK